MKKIFLIYFEYLISIRFNIISFQNPIEALNYFYQNISNCSLVIADYKMPQNVWNRFYKDSGERY
jgi:hypothetical protein